MDNEAQVQIKKLTEALDSLKGLQSQDGRKMVDLETHVEQLGSRESSPKIMVKSMEERIHEDKEKLLDLEIQLVQNKISHGNEKLKWHYLLEDANRRIAVLTQELQAINTNQVREKDEEILELKRTLTYRRDLHEEEKQKQELLVEEIQRDNQELMQKLSEMKDATEQLEEKMERQKRDNDRQKLDNDDLERTISKLENVTLHNSEFIRELELSVKVNRDILYKDSELDVIVGHLKTTKSENKRLKLGNIKYEEDNEKLRDENAAWKREINEFTMNRGYGEKDLLAINKKLRQENRNLKEQVETRMAYREMYEAAERELEAMRMKWGIEREALVLRISKLECEQQSDAVKFQALENANLQKMKIISELQQVNSLQSLS